MVIFHSYVSLPVDFHNRTSPVYPLVTKHALLGNHPQMDDFPN